MGPQFTASGVIDSLSRDSKNLSRSLECLEVGLSRLDPYQHPSERDGASYPSRLRDPRTYPPTLWLAASLFEFNISNKYEAGYPYLVYQAGEVSAG